jgi:hypothetical protein
MRATWSKQLPAWLAAAAAVVRTWHRQAVRTRPVSMQLWRKHTRLQQSRFSKNKKIRKSAKNLKKTVDE